MGGQCGSDLSKIREDVTEQLDVVPAVFTVHRHIRPQYACKNCETITAAPIPAAVINGGMAAVGLLVWVLIWATHLRRDNRQGLTVRPELVEGWTVKPLMVRQVHHERLNLKLSRLKWIAAITIPD